MFDSDTDSFYDGDTDNEGTKNNEDDKIDAEGEKKRIGKGKDESLPKKKKGKNGGNVMDKNKTGKVASKIGGGGVRMFSCGEDGCEFKAKTACNVKRHKAMVHDIDVVYHLCGVDGCEYKAKTASHLRLIKRVFMALFELIRV